MTTSKSNQNALLILLSEYLFIFLPFLVIGIIKIYKADFSTFSKPQTGVLLPQFYLGRSLLS